MWKHLLFASEKHARADLTDVVCATAEGLSSFAVEILDTATILRDATRHTMVLVDELGKGTETRAGSAIAGAVLEQLNQLRCRSGHDVWCDVWRDDGGSGVVMAGGRCKLSGGGCSGQTVSWFQA